MKKSVFIIVLISLMVLIIAGAGIGIFLSKDASAPSGNGGSAATDEDEPQKNSVDFFGEFEPFICSGEFISYSSNGHVINNDGMLFYTKSSGENGNHNKLVYALRNGDEIMLFSIKNSEVSIQTVAFIDDALYFSVSNSGDTDIDGLYRMTFSYNEAGAIRDSSLNLRFNGNYELVEAGNNTLLLKSGKQKYLFDTQTGDFTEYK